jgi:hypothetical protein
MVIGHRSGIPDVVYIPFADFPYYIQIAVQRQIERDDSGSQFGP